MGLLGTSLLLLVALYYGLTGTEIQGYEQKSYRHEETTSTRHAKGAGLD